MSSHRYHHRQCKNKSKSKPIYLDLTETSKANDQENYWKESEFMWVTSYGKRIFLKKTDGIKLSLGEFSESIMDFSLNYILDKHIKAASGDSEIMKTIILPSDIATQIQYDKDKAETYLSRIFETKGSDTFWILPYCNGCHFSLVIAIIKDYDLFYFNNENAVKSIASSYSQKYCNDLIKLLNKVCGGAFKLHTIALKAQKTTAGCGPIVLEYFEAFLNNKCKISAGDLHYQEFQSGDLMRQYLYNVFQSHPLSNLSESPFSPLEIKFPHRWKEFLMEDWRDVTKHHKIPDIPKENVVDILYNFQASNSKVTNEFIELISMLFNITFHRQLLYSFEKTSTVGATPENPINTYGMVHLCRLINKMPQWIHATNANSDYVNVENHIHMFISFWMRLYFRVPIIRFDGKTIQDLDNDDQYISTLGINKRK